MDFCWRLREAGHRLGFAPGAFVWHWRRPTIRTFLRQQLGYGQAERLLLAKHPVRFSRHGGARWQGFVYGGGAVRVMADSIIYHGPLGDAGYQAITNRMLPLRGLEKTFDSLKARLALKLVGFLQPRLRAWARNHTFFSEAQNPRQFTDPGPCEEFFITSPHGEGRDHFIKLLIQQGWSPAGETDGWDLEKSGSRLLIATEHGEGTAKRILVRAWGPQDFCLSEATWHKRI